MDVPLKMPDLATTGATLKVVRWLVAPGATVRRGEPILEVETDKAKRDAMIREATKIYVDDYAYVPLHQQALVWATRKNVDLVQPADNNFPLRWVTVK